jgi:hypothetical protein
MRDYEAWSNDGRKVSHCYAVRPNGNQLEAEGS